MKGQSDISGGNSKDTGCDERYQSAQIPVLLEFFVALPHFVLSCALTFSDATFSAGRALEVFLPSSFFLTSVPLRKAARMTIIALAGMLLGATLGMRFPVFAVIPGIACAALLAGLGWSAGDDVFGTLLVKLLLLLTFMQFGYLLGAALRLSLIWIGMPSYASRMPPEHSRPR
ncbi:MAG TPA: hypothetical protein VHE81_17645 [Lacipirellulaceae bacterium]|nr:hypothetical protein [Lacipirellulaceae bacterium]